MNVTQNNVHKKNGQAAQVVTLHNLRKANKDTINISCTIHTIQYNTIQYNTIQYNTIQYNTKQYNTIRHHTNCSQQN